MALASQLTFSMVNIRPTYPQRAAAVQNEIDATTTMTEARRKAKAHR
jgi:hypothetical protein